MNMMDRYLKLYNLNIITIPNLLNYGLQITPTRLGGYLMPVWNPNKMLHKPKNMTCISMQLHKLDSPREFRYAVKKPAISFAVKGP